MTKERLDVISETITNSNKSMRESLETNGFDNKVFKLPELVEAMNNALTSKVKESSELQEKNSVLQAQVDTLQGELNKITEKGIAEYVKMLANL